MELKKSDLPALTVIIDEILSVDYLLEYNDFDKHKTLIPTENEFKRLLYFITKYECGIVEQKKLCITVEKNENTKQFKSEGGFNKVFKDLNNTNSITRIKNRMTKWRYWIFWPAFVLTLSGAIFKCTESKAPLSNKTNTEKRYTPKAKKESEQSKQHTLPLDKKNQDSSFQTISDKKTTSRKRN